MLPEGGTYHPRYSVYLRVNPHPSFLIVRRLHLDHLKLSHGEYIIFKSDRATPIPSIITTRSMRQDKRIILFKTSDSALRYNWT